jgi:pimeloyl-ACP methyl ester carboxylesterase|tara:strand:- start:9313 stop:9984 length:672 start_codon:yes stop_codon:yes gene_type:complete
VVLLHGFGTSFSTTWEQSGWSALLSDAGRQVVPVDLLGHGEAAKPTDPEDYAEVEKLVLEQLPAEPVDAIGFSMGARVLLVLAAASPGRFNRLVVAGVGRNLFEEDQARRKAVIEAVRTGEAADPELAYFARLPDSPGADRTALAAFLARPDPPAVSGESLARVTLPVLVVLGDEDFAGPPDQLVAALPDATLRTLPGVDHFATPGNFGFIDAALEFIDAQPF